MFRGLYSLNPCRKSQAYNSAYQTNDKLYNDNLLIVPYPMRVQITVDVTVRSMVYVSVWSLSNGLHRLMS